MSDYMTDGLEVVVRCAARPPVSSTDLKGTDTVIPTVLSHSESGTCPHVAPNSLIRPQYGGTFHWFLT